jgi:NADH:ubiquinone oxidoreductase subunit 2 (subunit N)
MVLATALALFYYVRALHRVWLGQSDGAPAPKGEPRMAAGILVLLALIALVLGIFPGLILQA